MLTKRSDRQRTATWCAVLLLFAALVVGRAAAQEDADEQDALVTDEGDPLVIVSDTWAFEARRVPVTMFVRAEDTAAARFTARDMRRAMTLYSRLTGAPYPWATREYRQTGLWMTHGNNDVARTSFGGVVPDSQTQEQRPLLARLLPHETAHAWFPAYVDNLDRWLTEGFADLLAAQHWGATWGERGEQEYLLDDVQPVTARAGRLVKLHGPDSVAEPVAEVDAYVGGRTVLAMLKQYLGEQRFWAGVRQYVARYRDTTASTDDFRRALEHAAGEDLGWFFDQWVYGDRRPAFSVTAAYDEGTRRVVLQVEQTQGSTDIVTVGPRGDTRPRRKITTAADIVSSDGVVNRSLEAFRMPVTIRVVTARGDVTTTVQLDSKRQAIIIDDVPSAPTMIVFDDLDGIWKTLEFEQPTAWLSAQLEREPTPWQTAWAIEQLRARAARDSLAAAALRRAAETGRYALTRAQAAKALESR